jgi:hypothetical protein
MGVLCAILYVFAMYVAMHALCRKLDTLIWRRTRKREAAKPVQMARTRLATIAARRGLFRSWRCLRWWRAGAAGARQAGTAGARREANRQIAAAGAAGAEKVDARFMRFAVPSGVIRPDAVAAPRVRERWRLRSALILKHKGI